MGVYGSGVYGAALYGLPASTIAAVEQSTYPPRIAITVTGLLVGDAITIRRSVSGTVTTPAIRGVEGFVMTDTSAVFFDAEQPFGAAITYQLELGGQVIASATPPLTSVLPGAKVALSDAISGDSAEVVVMAWPTRTADRVSSVFSTIGGRRTILVSGQVQGATSTITLFTETALARTNLKDLLDNATSGILLLRSPDPKYTGTDAYLGILSVTETRYSQDGSDDRRLWDLSVVELSAWASVLTTAGSAWGDVIAAYTGLTWGNLSADFASWLAVEGYNWPDVT